MMMLFSCLPENVRVSLFDPSAERESVCVSVTIERSISYTYREERGRAFDTRDEG